MSPPGRNLRSNLMSPPSRKLSSKKGPGPGRKLRSEKGPAACTRSKLRSHQGPALSTTAMPPPCIDRAPFEGRPDGKTPLRPRTDAGSITGAAANADVPPDAETDANAGLSVADCTGKE